MRKILCDRCGKEIPNENAVNCVEFHANPVNNHVATGFELCGACFTTVIRYTNKVGIPSPKASETLGTVENSE